MIYCKKCIIPNTRPNVFILPDGVCTACKSFINKKKIDWREKKIEFEKIVKNIKSKKKTI